MLRDILSDLIGRTPLGYGKKDGDTIRGCRPYPVINTKGLDHEWVVGLEWYLSRIEGDSILDLGFVAHKSFSELLASLGFYVIGVDLKAYIPNIPNLTTIINPVWATGVATSSANTVIANSLFEHLGKGCYNQPENNAPGVATLTEIKAVLKPGGILLGQVPCAKDEKLVYHKKVTFYTCWTPERIKYEMERYKLTLEEVEYFAKDRRGWIKVNSNIAGRIPQGGGFPVCLAYFKARKSPIGDFEL